MADDLSINIKDKKIHVLKINGARFFAVGGAILKDHSARPDQIVLKNKADKVVASGHLFRHPKHWKDSTDVTEKLKGVWAAWFDIDHLMDVKKELSLTVLEMAKDGTSKSVFSTAYELELVDDLKGSTIKDRFVGVSYPNESVAPGTIISFGSFGPVDRTVLRVHIQNSDGDILSTDSNPVVTKSGFWSATLGDVQAGTNMRVIAFGDVSTGKSSTFDVA